MICLFSVRAQAGQNKTHSWWQAADHAVKALHLTCAKQLQHVRGIGLSGQMHGMVALDKGGAPAARHYGTIQDERTAELDENPAFRAISGNAVKSVSPLQRLYGQPNMSQNALQGQQSFYCLKIIFGSC